MRTCRRLLLLLLLLLPLPVLATTYHVKQMGGDDHNTCTSATNPNTAKQTLNGGGGLQGGLACLQPSDKLIIYQGLYPERIKYESVPSGTSGNPTIIQANGNAFAGTGDSVELRPPNDNGYPALRIYGHDITLDGFILDGRNQQVYMYLLEIYLCDTCTSQRITIRNMELRNTIDTCDAWTYGGAGISGNHNDSGNTYQNNHIHHISTYGGKRNCTAEGQPRESNQTIHGIYTTGNNETIDGNIIHDNAGWGIHQFANAIPANNSIFRNNLIYNNQGFGLQVSSGDNTVAYNNVIYGSRRHCINIGQYGLQATNSKIYNNTCYSNGEHCITLGGTNGTLIRNNICYGNVLNDIWDYGGSSYLASNNFISNSPAASTLFVNVNAVPKDLHLAGTAPNPPVDAGVSTATGPIVFDTDKDLNNRRVGTGQDEGAYELGASAPLPPTNTLVDKWTFDENTGTSANDTGTPGGNTGTLTSGATWFTPGRIGVSAIQCDGVDDRVLIAGLLGNLTTLSVTVWANVLDIPGTVNVRAEVISIGDYVSIAVDTLSAFGFYYFGGDWLITSVSQTYVGTGWHHYAYVVSPGLQKFYVDGVLKATTTDSRTVSYSGLGNHTELCNHGNNAVNKNMHGMLDDVRVYNYVLADSDVATLYSLGARSVSHRAVLQ